MWSRREKLRANSSMLSLCAHLLSAGWVSTSGRHCLERAAGETAKQAAQRFRGKAHHPKMGGHCQVFVGHSAARHQRFAHPRRTAQNGCGDRKSTRLNSSHVAISYAVFCLKKKTQNAIVNMTRGAKQ